MVNILNGGRHASGSTDIQEFMILPVGASTFPEAIRMSTEVFHSLGDVLRDERYGTTVGDEGGYAPAVRGGNVEALQLIMRAIERAGYRPGDDVALGLDIASSEFHGEHGYTLAKEGRTLSSGEMVDWIAALRAAFPIVTIEDGLAEDDWGHWSSLTTRIGTTTQLVGDDLLVTNVTFLERAIREGAGNAILIKPNQIGTLSETIDAIEMATRSGWKSIVSHRSGETEDTFIADLAVGLATGQIKTGSMSRTDRVAKYNQLLRITEELSSEAVFAGRAAIARS
jgi:enolase